MTTEQKILDAAVARFAELSEENAAEAILVALKLAIHETARACHKSARTCLSRLVMRQIRDDFPGAFAS